MRVLLLLAFLAVVLIALSRLPAAWRSRLPPSAPRRDELVKDPVCQTYVVMSRAIRSEVGGGAPAFFCSRECAERFQRGERRA